MFEARVAVFGLLGTFQRTAGENSTMLYLGKNRKYGLQSLLDLLQWAFCARCVLLVDGYEDGQSLRKRPLLDGYSNNMVGIVRYFGKTRKTACKELLALKGQCPSWVLVADARGRRVIGALAR